MFRHLLNYKKDYMQTELNERHLIFMIECILIFYSKHKPHHLIPHASTQTKKHVYFKICLLSDNVSNSYVFPVAVHSVVPEPGCHRRKQHGLRQEERCVSTPGGHGDYCTPGNRIEYCFLSFRKPIRRYNHPWSTVRYRHADFIQRGRQHHAGLVRLEAGYDQPSDGKRRVHACSALPPAVGEIRYTAAWCTRRAAWWRHRPTGSCII